MKIPMASAQRALAVLGIAGAIGASLLVGPGVGAANADGCVYRDQNIGVLCFDDRGGHRDFRGDRGDCDRCGGPSREYRIRANWGYNYTGRGEAVPFDTRNWGCLWVEKLPLDGYHIEVSGNRGSDPVVYWVSDW